MSSVAASRLILGPAALRAEQRARVAPSHSRSPSPSSWQAEGPLPQCVMPPHEYTDLPTGWRAFYDEQQGRHVFHCAHTAAKKSPPSLERPESLRASSLLHKFCGVIFPSLPSIATS